MANCTKILDNLQWTFTPPILTQTDRSQLQTSVERIFHEAQQDPNLSALLSHTTVEEIMSHPTKYIRQWVTNSHKHLQDYQSAREKQATIRTRDIRQFFTRHGHPPQPNRTAKNLLRPP